MTKIKERVTRIEDKIKDLTKERSTDRLKEMVEKQNNREVFSSVTKRQKSLIKTSKKENNSKVTDRAISITYKDKEKDELRETSLIGIIHEDNKGQNTDNIKEKEVKTKEMTKRQNSEKICSKLKTKEDVGKVIRNDMLKENNAFKESLRRKLETKDEIGKVNKGRKNNNYGNLKEKENSDSVVKVKVEVKDKKCNSLRGKIDERVELIERSIIDTQNDSLTELIKKIKILNTPLQTSRKRDVTILNTTELSDNENTDKHIRNIICHKCKEYGHTKKQCDRHNKIIKQISKLEFEKDIIKELMEIFNVSPKEIDQVKKESKSTNPLKISKRKRKQKDIIMKLIENLPNHYKDKK